MEPDNETLCRYTQYIYELPYNLTYSPIISLSRENSRTMIKYLDQLLPQSYEALYWIRVRFKNGIISTKIGRSNNIIRRLGYDYFNTEQYSQYIDTIDIHGLFYANNIKEQERIWLNLTREYEMKPLLQHDINTLEYRCDFMNNYEMQQYIWVFSQQLQSIVKCIVG